MEPYGTPAVTVLMIEGVPFTETSKVLQATDYQSV